MKLRSNRIITTVPKNKGKQEKTKRKNQAVVSKKEIPCLPEKRMPKKKKKQEKTRIKNQAVASKKKIQCLPVEMITEILKQLSPEDTASGALVCRKWRRASRDPAAWRRTTISVTLERAMQFANGSKLWATIVRRRFRKVWITDCRAPNWDHRELKKIDEGELIASLCRISGLSSLTVIFRHVEMNFVAQIANQTELKISLSKYGLSGSLITSDLKNLVRLRLDDSRLGEITDAIFRLICIHLKLLKHLTVTGCYRITDMAICYMGRPIRPLPIIALEYLKVVDCEKLTYLSMMYLGLGQPGLRFVCLPLTAGATVFGLGRLMGMPHLRTCQLQLLSPPAFIPVDSAPAITDITYLLRARCQHFPELIQPRGNRVLYSSDGWNTIQCRDCLPLIGR